MDRHKFFIILLFVSILSSLQLQAQTNSDSNTNENKSELMIVMSSLEINDEALRLSYEIINNSEDDIWIYAGTCDPSVKTLGMDASVYMAGDGHTLMIWGRFKRWYTESYRLQIPVPFCPIFIRLRPGQCQTESIFIKIPVCLWIKSDNAGQQEQGLRYATHLAIELGYYSGNDLPETVLKMLEEKEKNRSIDSGGSVLQQFFSSPNEHLSSRDEELIIMSAVTIPLIEKSSRMVIDNVHIPYREASTRILTYERPDLSSCTKIEIKYQPSMLDYFFPFTFQHRLLSPQELDYLKSEKTLIVEDTKKIKAITNDISKARNKLTLNGGFIARYRSSVDLVCHYDDRPPMLFFIYNDNAVRVDCDVLPCTDGFPGLKMLIPRIQAIDLRMRCAANLKNMWYRFRIYRFHEAVRFKDPSIRNQTAYPTLTQWCDEMRRIYPVFRSITLVEDKHICPSAGEGKNHYAMNPNCEPNSPGDMVLLFETEVGWNQHGGPELFTFDNHDPKGGCVLLNDGTVKFIRTKEELNALKWK